MTLSEVRVDVAQDHILFRQPGRVSQWMYARLALALSMTVDLCQSVLRVCLVGQASVSGCIPDWPFPIYDSGSMPVSIKWMFSRSGQSVAVCQTSPASQVGQDLLLDI